MDEYCLLVHISFGDIGTWQHNHVSASSILASVPYLTADDLLEMQVSFFPHRRTVGMIAENG